jgi:acetyl esterase/lipase
LCAVTVLASTLLTAPPSEVTAEAVRYRDISFPAAAVVRDVPYRQAVDVSGARQTLTLDLYEPEGDLESRRPAIIWIHGGGFRPGNDKRQKYIVTMATEYARRGYVSVAPDYRVRAEVGADRMPALREALEDCRAALEWVRANAAAHRIDAARIAIGGGSAGGMIAVNLAAVEGRPSGGGRGVFALVDLWGSPSASLMAADVGPGYPPTIIVHGTADELVPFSQSEQFAAALTANSVEHELRAIPGAPHTPTGSMPDIIEWTAAFVYRALARASAPLR